MIDGNMIALSQRNVELERHEAEQERISEIIKYSTGEIDKVKAELNRLHEVIDSVIEQCEDLIGKLEGER